MNHLRESYSILKGFLPNSQVEAGKEYLAHSSEGEPARVYIDSIVEGVNGNFDIQLTYEADRSTDFWNVAPEQGIFRPYVEVVKEERKGVKILGLKKKSLNEGKKEGRPDETYKVVMKPEHKVQIGDDVIYDKQRASVIGAIGEKWIIQCQYSTYTVESKDLTALKAKRDVYGYDQFKFDEQTQNLLFEQMVSCGIYMGNTPVKITGCNVKYSDWRDGKDDTQLRILIEGSTQFFPKSQIRIFEDINDFANLDNYIEGVIVDEEDEKAVENVLINAEDYTSTVGDAESVRVIRKVNGESELETIPKAWLKTLSI
jgi:hypothetical protein